MARLEESCGRTRCLGRRFNANTVPPVAVSSKCSELCIGAASTTWHDSRAPSSAPRKYYWSQYYMKQESGVGDERVETQCVETETQCEKTEAHQSRRGESERQERGERAQGTSGRSEE